MDSIATGSVASMPTCTVTFYPHSGCTWHMHHAIVFTRNVEGLPDVEPSR